MGDIKYRMEAIVLPTSKLPDVLAWTHAPDGILTSKLALSFLRTSTTLLPWADHIWSPVVPPSHSCIYWRLHHGKMPMDENLRNRGCIVVSVSSLCMTANESSERLFLWCQFATHLWQWIVLEQGCFTSHLLSFDNNKVLKIINWIC